MKLVLVRHGRPDESHPARPHDPPLMDAGHRQAMAVADRLANKGITHIVSSPLLRARETAQPLSERLGLPIQVIDGWAEADRHTERYRSTETLRSLGAAEWGRFLEDPVTYLGGDAEHFRGAVLSALASTIELPSEGTVAVFTHGLPINVVLSHALGLERIVHFSPGYGSVTQLRAHSVDAIGVASVNELWHQERNKQ
jgi:broad specificity phosphatase PhoE